VSRYPICRRPAGAGIEVQSPAQIVARLVRDLLQHRRQAVGDAEETQLALKEG
jgi:hypothetical protein